MSVNYSLAHMSSEPGNPDAPKKWYAKAQASGEVTLDEMAEDIAYATTLTDADVLAAIRAFIKQLNKHLANGKIVRAENLGSFQLQIQSTGADTEEDFTTANITGVSIQFRPGKTVAGATTRGLGSLTTVTAVFGQVLATLALEELVEKARFHGLDEAGTGE